MSATQIDSRQVTVEWTRPNGERITWRQDAPRRAQKTLGLVSRERERMRWVDSAQSVPLELATVRKAIQGVVPVGAIHA